MERLEVVVFCAALVAALSTAYFGIKMSQDLKEPLGKPTTIPLMIEDAELTTRGGLRYRLLFHRSLMAFFALAVLGAVLMNYWHG